MRDSARNRQWWRENIRCEKCRSSDFGSSTVRLQQEEDDTSLIFNENTFEEADIKPINPLFFAQL